MSVETEVRKLVKDEINKRNYMTPGQVDAAIRKLLKDHSPVDKGKDDKPKDTGKGSGVKLPHPGGKLLYDLISSELDPTKYNKTFTGAKWKKSNTGRPNPTSGTSQTTPNGYVIGHPQRYIPPQLVDGVLRCFIEPGQKNFRGDNEAHCMVKLNPKGYSGGWIPARKRHIFDIDCTTHGNWKKNAALVWQLHPSDFGRKWDHNHRQPPVSLHLTKTGKWMLVVFGSSQTVPTKYDSASIKKFLPHKPGQQIIRVEVTMDHTGKNALLRATINGASMEIAKVPMGINLRTGKTFCSVGLYGGYNNPLAYVDLHRVRVFAR